MQETEFEQYVLKIESNDWKQNIEAMEYFQSNQNDKLVEPFFNQLSKLLTSIRSGIITKTLSTVQNAFKYNQELLNKYYCKSLNDLISKYALTTQKFVSEKIDELITAIIPNLSNENQQNFIEWLTTCLNSKYVQMRYKAVSIVFQFTLTLSNDQILKFIQLYLDNDQKVRKIARNIYQKYKSQVGVNQSIDEIILREGE